MSRGRYQGVSGMAIDEHPVIESAMAGRHIGLSMGRGRRPMNRYFALFFLLVLGVGLFWT